MISALMEFVVWRERGMNHVFIEMTVKQLWQDRDLARKEIAKLSAINLPFYDFTVFHQEMESNFPTLNLGWPK